MNLQHLQDRQIISNLCLNLLFLPIQDIMLLLLTMPYCVQQSDSAAWDQHFASELPHLCGHHWSRFAFSKIGIWFRIWWKYIKIGMFLTIQTKGKGATVFLTYYSGLGWPVLFY